MTKGFTRSKVAIAAGLFGDPIHMVERARALQPDTMQPEKLMRRLSASFHRIAGTLSPRTTG